MEQQKQSIMEFDHVIKRNGHQEKMSLDKIERRIANLCDGLSVNLSRVTRDVASQMYNGMKTYELDELSAQICASLCTEHPDYGTLASRIIVSNHHKSYINQHLFNLSSNKCCYCLLVTSSPGHLSFKSHVLQNSIPTTPTTR